MVITELLERNARLYGAETALVEINPSEERDRAVTWREASLIESASPDAPYRRAMSWKDFDRQANRFANLLLSRGVERGAKVGILLMNCLEWLPVYFGILKAGCVAVPLNFRYSSEEIQYCLELADVEVLVFGPEFIGRMDPIAGMLHRVRMLFFVGRGGPVYAEDCLRLVGFCAAAPPGRRRWPSPRRTRPPSIFPPAPPASPRPSSTATGPWPAPARRSRTTTARPGGTSFFASRPSTTPGQRCTGSAASFPAAGRCCCGG